MRPQQQTFQPDLDDEDTLAWQSDMREFRLHECFGLMLAVSLVFAFPIPLWLQITIAAVALFILMPFAVTHIRRQLTRRGHWQKYLRAVCDAQGITFYDHDDSLLYQWRWAELVKISYLQGGGIPRLAIHDIQGNAIALGTDFLKAADLQDIARQAQRWLQNTALHKIPAPQEPVIVPHTWYMDSGTVANNNFRIFLCVVFATIPSMFIQQIIQNATSYKFHVVTGLLLCSAPVVLALWQGCKAYQYAFGSKRTLPYAMADEDMLSLYRDDGSIFNIPWEDMRAVRFVPKTRKHGPPDHFLFTDRLGDTHRVVVLHFGVKTGYSVADYATAVLEGHPLALPDDDVLFRATLFGWLVLGVNVAFIPTLLFPIVRRLGGPEFGENLIIGHVLFNAIAFILGRWQSRCDDD